MRHLSCRWAQAFEYLMDRGQTLEVLQSHALIVFACGFGAQDRARNCYTWDFGAWLSLVERLVRDQEAGGSNPLAPTNSFNNLQAVAWQTAHPTAHPVAKLLPDSFALILRAWRRTQPRTPP